MVDHISNMFTMYIFVISCTWTGMNALAGLYTAAITTMARKKVPPFKITELTSTDLYTIGMMLTSALMLMLLLVGSFNGVMLLVEMLVVLNIFFTGVLATLNVELYRFLRDHPDNDLLL